MTTENQTDTGNAFLHPLGAPQPSETSRDRPTWIRLPRPGEACVWTGLSKSTLWNIVKTGEVRTATLKLPGKKKGARLIHLESLIRYLETLTVEDRPGGENAKEESLED